MNPRNVFLIGMIVVSAASIWQVVAQSAPAAAGPDIPFAASFDVTDAPETFAITTLVLDFPPGAAVPLHKHPGRGAGIVLSGTLTSVTPDGHEHVLVAGDSWVEELGHEHFVRNASSEPVRLLFTLLVPVGEEIMIYPQ